MAGIGRPATLLPLLCLLTAACGTPAAPEAPPGAPALRRAAPPYGEPLRRELDLASGTWRWTWAWRPAAASPAAGAGASPAGSAGTVDLAVAGGRAVWSFRPPVPPPAEAAAGTLRLRPADGRAWHTLAAPWPPADPLALLPLPRRPVASPAYADLLDLLQELTAPRFGQRVAHWPALPVPVRAAPAPSGELDLAECLHEAVDLWNEGEPEPVFVWDPQAAWGVRLVHLPGTDLSPPLTAQVVRLDADGRPLRLHVTAGDDYDHRRDRRCAVRALAHELAHARLLWGHSRERDHLLWRWGPVVPGPSADERRAARLLALLPEGLDLSRYGRSADLEVHRHQGGRRAVEQLRRRQAPLPGQGRRRAQRRQLHRGALVQRLQQDALQE